MHKPLCLIPLVMLLSGNLMASKCDSLHPYLPPGDEVDVTIPFSNLAIDNEDENGGLCISYDLKQNPAQKIVCTLNNSNQGWMLYQENNMTRETSTFVGTSSVTFFSVLPTVLTAATPAYHVDESGLIAIHHFKDDQFPVGHATASCSYENAN
jgi:hypothetical protein